MVLIIVFSCVKIVWIFFLLISIFSMIYIIMWRYKKLLVSVYNLNLFLNFCTKEILWISFILKRRFNRKLMIWMKYCTFGKMFEKLLKSYATSALYIFIRFFKLFSRQWFKKSKMALYNPGRKRYFLYSTEEGGNAFLKVHSRFSILKHMDVFSSI